MDDLIKAVVTIRLNRIMSMKQLAKEIGIHYVTLRTFLEGRNLSRFLTRARILRFVKANKEYT